MAGLDPAMTVRANGSRSASRGITYCISGWYGNDNTGDEAILRQFIASILGKTNGNNLTILASNFRRAYALYSRSNIKVTGHPHIFGRGGLANLLRGRTSRHIRLVRSADVVVVGGGSLLHDRSGLRSLLHVLDEIWLAKLFRKPVALFAIGVGPLHRKISRWLVARTAIACDLITVRDRGSRRLLIQLGVPEDRIHLVADPALILTPRPVSAARVGLLDEFLSTLKTDAVGVFLLDDLSVDAKRRAEIISSLATAFDRIHEGLGLRFVFLPMMSEVNDDDRIIAREVVAGMKNPDAAILLEQTLEPEEMLWLSGQFLFNITVRLHALLFSLASMTPAIAISYDPKVVNAMEDFSLSEFVIQLDNVTPGEIYDKSVQIQRSREQYVARISSVLPDRLQAARLSFTLIRDLTYRC